MLQQAHGRLQTQPLQIVQRTGAESLRLSWVNDSLIASVASLTDLGMAIHLVEKCMHRATNGWISNELTLEILISITKLAKFTLISHVELIL